MAEITETLLSQKLDRSSWRTSDATDNFKEEKELTVEITLAEYRDLITKVAKSNYEISKKEDENRELSSENLHLKERVEHLEKVLKEIKCYKDESTKDESEDE